MAAPRFIAFTRDNETGLLSVCDIVEPLPKYATNFYSRYRRAFARGDIDRLIVEQSDKPHSDSSYRVIFAR